MATTNTMRKYSLVNKINGKTKRSFDTREDARSYKRAVGNSSQYKIWNNIMQKAVR